MPVLLLLLLLLGDSKFKIENLQLNAPALIDGDDEFMKVDTRTPAHQLPPGVAADAINKRFEDGRAWPRHNVNGQKWGKPAREYIPAGAEWQDNFLGESTENWPPFYQVTGLTVGQKYRWTAVDGNTLSTDRVESNATHYDPAGTRISTEVFIATATSYYLWAPADVTDGSKVRDKIDEYLGDVCGFSRFNDPNGVDSLVLLTNDYRDSADVTVNITDTDATANSLTAPSHGLTIGQAFTASGITGFSGTKYAYPLTLNTLKAYDSVANALAGGATGLFDVTADDETGTITKAGGDGGRGRAWLLRAGNAAAEIPLNGHDVWDTARLVPCYNGLTLLRHGNERHYFDAGAVDAANDQIQLNCAPAWANGDLVLFVADPDSYILGANSNTLYFVKNISGNKVELYTDAALANILALAANPLGTFYLERRAAQPGFYGNGAPPLLMQPAASGLTAFENGFRAVSSTVQISDTDATNEIITAENHRLIPGDAFTATGVTGLTGGTTYYAKPLNDHQLKAYDTLANALAGGSTGLMNLTTDDQTGTLTKVSAGGLPMPPAREGVYTANNRNILVNGKNNVAISDPLDPLHYTPFSASFSANLGEADEVKSVIPFGEDSILFIKELVVLALHNFSAGAASWALKEVTREYGGIAPLATVLVGADVWFLSRRGVASVVQTIQGKLQGSAEPVSWPMKKYIDRIEWKNAHQAVAAHWNNRYFLAVPLKGQTGTIKNNGLIVYNTVNKGWEGLWQGDELEIYAFARHNVFGDERLCFVDYNGVVKWLGDGFKDHLGDDIEDSLTTRIYTGRNAQRRMGRKTWLSGEVIWDTHKPNLSIRAQAPGYNEYSDVLVDKAYDPTAYLVYGQDAYDPDTAEAEDFDAPHREDYSLTAQEVMIGKLDVHQNITEGFRMRLDDWGVQLVISNTNGSARVQAVEVQGVEMARTNSRAV